MQTHDYSNQHESTSFHEQFGIIGDDMNKNIDEKNKKQPLISFKYHPGFFCFFQDYVNSQDWTFYQCYNKVFQSHHQMMKIRRPVEDIVKDDKLTKQQKFQQLTKRAEKDRQLIYYSRPENTDSVMLEGAVIVYEKEKQKKVNQLKQKLKKLETVKQHVISRKKQQFHKKNLQKSLQQQKQIQNMNNEKVRRANLVRQIQMQQQQRRLNRQKQRLQNNNNMNGSNCQIM